MGQIQRGLRKQSGVSGSFTFGTIDLALAATAAEANSYFRVPFPMVIERIDTYVTEAVVGTSTAPIATLANVTQSETLGTVTVADASAIGTADSNTALSNASVAEGDVLRFYTSTVAAGGTIAGMIQATVKYRRA